MFLKVLYAKIHRATITDANADYVGSITIDRALMDAAGLVSGQCVLVADLANGERFETYVIEGPAGSGMVCINGAAAQLVNVGDLVIVMAFAYVELEKAGGVEPRIVHVDADNRVMAV